MSRANRTCNNKLLAVVNMLALSLFVMPSFAGKTDQEPNAVDDGARIFAERCVLCHGNYGAGDGFLSLVVKNYPRTNLLGRNENGHFTELKNQVNWGGTTGEMHSNSPPWAEELDPEEIATVSQFVIALQETPEQARRSLDIHLIKKPVNLETGRLVYQTRCASCHGVKGKGDGPIAVVVQNPLPTNLVKSQMSELGLQLIITDGGASIGRSPQMPAWKHELSQVQIDSVKSYIRQLRE